MHLCESYQIFRRDRYVVSDARGGGVLLACKSYLDCSLVDLPTTSICLDVEFIALKLSLSNLHVYILCCYIPPNSINSINDNGQNVYDLIITIINHIHDMMNSTDEILLIGDFNLPNIQWVWNEDDEDYLPSKNSTAKELLFLDSVSSFGLSQLSNVKNDMGRQLDLIFCTDPGNMIVEPSTTILSTLDKYHPPLTITYSFDSENCTVCDVEQFTFNFRKANFSEITKRLTSIDFNSLLSGGCVDESVQKFYLTLSDLFSSCVPYERLKSSSSSPPWFNSELKRLKNKKNKLWKSYLRDRDASSHNNFLVCYNEFRELSSTLYDEYIDSMHSKLHRDPKTFFKFINMKKKVDSYPNTMEFGGSASSNPSEIGNMFASFFEGAFAPSNFQPEAANFSHMKEPVSVPFETPSISCDAVQDHINELPADFTSGPDGIPPVIIRSCSDGFITPLRILFQKSLDSGCFPQLWKNSYIIPIHKKGCKRDISNYRPIAKLSCLPKLFESIIYSQLSASCKGLLSSNQHGFLSGRSTTTNLLEFTSDAINGLAKGNQTDCIYTDFSKAFDRLSHSVILFKMKRLGFPPSFISWTQSYLANRTYQVLFRRSISRVIAAPSGVPQGSHLGPLFFVLSIDDIVHLLQHCKILIYADDIKMYRRVERPNDCSLLQADLDRFYRWCSHNNLSLNLNKCEIMTFCRTHNPISFDYTLSTSKIGRVQSVTDLGVVFDQKLDFINHINRIVSRSSSMLGFIKRWTREFSSIPVSIKLYNSFVRPLLEYACQVWCPYFSVHINRIESVQRNFVRFALRRLPWNNALILPPYRDRLGLLNLHTLEKRRMVADVVFVHQLLNSNIDSSYLRSRIVSRDSFRHLRRLPLLHVNFSRTNYGMFEPINRMCMSVNNKSNLFEVDVSKAVMKKRLY